MTDVTDWVAPVLEVRDVEVAFRGRRPSPWSRAKPVKAVAGVSFELHEGETLGIVGESGSGKTTLARAIVGLVAPTAGSIRFRGKELRPGRPVGRDVQMVFQDPFASVSPTRTVRQIVAEPIENHEPSLSKAEVAAKVDRLLAAVQLPPSFADRRPRAMSGGQLQRVGIARALAVDPALLVADEPVSALDVSVQAQVLNLLADLRDERRISCVFIGHNLAVVEHVADRILVMRDGVVVEGGPASQIVGAPQHPYTKALLAAVPRFDGTSRRARAAHPNLLRTTRAKDPVS
jgi:oligopeptide transport system ATP-binding protein